MGGVGSDPGNQHGVLCDPIALGQSAGNRVGAQTCQQVKENKPEQLVNLKLVKARNLGRNEEMADSHAGRGDLIKPHCLLHGYGL